MLSKTIFINRQEIIDGKTGRKIKEKWLRKNTKRILINMDVRSRIKQLDSWGFSGLCCG